MDGAALEEGDSAQEEQENEGGSTPPAAEGSGDGGGDDDTVSASTHPTSPHIIFVMVDDMGFNDIGYQSSDLGNVTTTLNKLAASGVTLENYYTLHMCTPARAAFMTGWYPMRSGMQLENVKPDSPWGLPLALATLPQGLGALGYSTHCVGKWGLGHFAPEYLPNYRGFDTFYGYLSDEIDYYSHRYPSPFENKYYTDFIELSARQQNTYTYLNSNGTYTTELFSAKIESLVAMHNASVPFFLYYSAQNVHGPLDLPPTRLFTPAEWAKLDGIELTHRKTFAAMLLALDWSVEKLVRAMQLKGLWQETVFVLASDNGGCWEQGGSNVPLRGGKHFLFEGGTRVPSFVHSPMLPSSRRGTSHTGLVHAVDWMATLLNVAAGGDPIIEGYIAGSDGVNQWPSLADAKTTSSRTEVLLNLNSWTLCCSTPEGGDTCDGFLSDCANPYLAGLRKANATRAALISGNWKIVLNEFAQPWYGTPVRTGEYDPDTEVNQTGQGSNCGANPGTMAHSYLFNLRDDPYETNDLRLSRPEVFDRLFKRVVEVARREVASIWTAETVQAYHLWSLAGDFIRPWCSNDGTGSDCGDAGSAGDDAGPLSEGDVNGVAAEGMGGDDDDADDASAASRSSSASSGDSSSVSGSVSGSASGSGSSNSVDITEDDAAPGDGSPRSKGNRESHQSADAAASSARRLAGCGGGK